MINKLNVPRATAQYTLGVRRYDLNSDKWGKTAKGDTAILCIQS